MIYQLEEFTCEALDLFIEKINKLEKWEPLKIFVNSNWWDVTIKDCYINIINSLDNVELIWVICVSAWFELMYWANCKKTILESSYWMVHLEAWVVSTWAKWVIRWDYDKFKHKTMNEEDLKYKDVLTDEEYKYYEEWNNVYLNYKRLKEILAIK